MVQATLESMKWISLLEKEFTNGRMAKVTKVSGSTDSLRVKGSRNSQMAQYLMECGRKDYREDWEYASIPTEAATMVIGKMASHMEWVRKFLRMGPLSTVDGSKAKLEALV